ncbi:MAG: TlyA family RNA methyltransferase [Parvibaculum sp.]|jgi:23S rRNA (cytidine1920-2'-O)/16S rRNA (cytidine1409-2'-O)-methyltransferase
MSGGKVRLDQLLVERGLAPSRARAQAAIKAGQVSVGGALITKASAHVGPDVLVEIDALEHRYVSRGALKLLHALDHFGWDVRSLNALDLGASTGGFTQVLLERGAAHVTAIDVGHDQLAPELVADARVTSFEGLNSKDIAPEHLARRPALLVADLSFISLRKALPPVLALVPGATRLIALIKPQFEAGKGNVGKGGIVKDEALQAQICEEISSWLENDCGWRVIGLTPSPITGGDGNREFLIAAIKEAE